MTEEERKYADLFQSLALEIAMAQEDRQLRHFTRMLEMSCRKLRTSAWGEPADVSDAVSIAAGEAHP